MSFSPASTPPLIFDLSLCEIQERLHSLGEPSYRADQLWKGLYCQLVASLNEFTNLPGNLRCRLDQELRFTHLSPAGELHSADRETTKT
ncbi:MAG: 23S rRNA (adenine(2503)-C2)-methyltransferase, partial [Anaerolineaceae bacterium]|nr:23S rRNA (adenine(2503)-C2)-methyltransferase [Anaerolineaceae bacterium]